MSWAHDFPAHLRKIKKIEAQIRILDDELERKVAAKNTTRDQGRIEEILQRIVEIHSELISQRQGLDEVLVHVKADHKEEGKKANLVNEVNDRLAVDKRKNVIDPLQNQLNALFRKIQSKYASFVVDRMGDEDMEEVEVLVKKKKQMIKEKESNEYLRRKSKVKLVK